MYALVLSVVCDAHVRLPTLSTNRACDRNDRRDRHVQSPRISHPPNVHDMTTCAKIMTTAPAEWRCNWVYEYLYLQKFRYSFDQISKITLCTGVIKIKVRRGLGQSKLRPCKIMQHHRRWTAMTAEKHERPCKEGTCSHPARTTFEYDRDFNSRLTT